MGDFIVDNDGYTVVYTDGACLSNGRGGARAGIGVWFRGGNSYNLSQPVIGRATNNNAEIQAITAAANQASAADIEYLKIFTDSQFAINCATKWIYTWKKNGWRTKDGRVVINKPELEIMDKALNQLQHVKFVHIRSHQGNYGNQEADRLAREGCEMYQEYSCVQDYDSSSSDDYY